MHGWSNIGARLQGWNRGNKFQGHLNEIEIWLQCEVGAWGVMGSTGKAVLRQKITTGTERGRHELIRRWGKKCGREIEKRKQRQEGRMVDDHSWHATRAELQCHSTRPKGAALPSALCSISCPRFVQDLGAAVHDLTSWSWWKRRHVIVCLCDKKAERVRASVSRRRREF